MEQFYDDQQKTDWYCAGEPKVYCGKCSTAMVVSGGEYRDDDIDYDTVVGLVYPQGDEYGVLGRSGSNVGGNACAFRLCCRGIENELSVIQRGQKDPAQTAL